MPRLESIAKSRWKALLAQLIEEKIRLTLRLDLTQPIIPGQPLQELGLDSLLSIELRNALGIAINRTLPATLLFNYPTLEALTDFLFRELGGDAVPGATDRKAKPVRQKPDRRYRVALRRRGQSDAGRESDGRSPVSDFLSRISKLSPQRLALLAAELNERLETLEAERSEPIAIVGMGCRYPGGVNDAESFWKLLSEGVDAIREVPSDRWNADAFYDPNPDIRGKMTTRWGGFIDGHDQFDPKFFGIAPAEAVPMDPQQRLLLETTWEALEDAGIPPSSLAGSHTGVFIGICNLDYGYVTLRASREKINAYFASGLSHAIAAGRISYLLGLEGPSLAVDTSCSASLMAVHLACQSLRRKESHLALAGGANLILKPEVTIALSQSRMMAPDGRCKPFSDEADGFVRAEGSGMIVLKRLRDAVQDGNRILAVIRGTAANQDGRSSGLTAPNGRSQEAVIAAALADAGLGPDDLQYIEAHGTGTALGDPIEIGALGNVFAERSSGCGTAARRLCKKQLRPPGVCCRHRRADEAGAFAPASADSRQPALPKPNHRIEWDRLPIRIATQTENWPERAGKRTGGVSSFGFSGTNVHVIVEEHLREPETPQEALPLLFPVSAKSKTALQLDRSAAGQLRRPA